MQSSEFLNFLFFFYLVFTMIGIVFDMDGVIYRGNQPVGGVKDVIKFLRVN
ncbi:MAG TPA: HAD family hydrolase, partial [Thermococcus sp.]|nr:HAD family hydrolase [Thermococcus sp.]